MFKELIFSQLLIIFQENIVFFVKSLKNIQLQFGLLNLYSKLKNINLFLDW